MLQNLPTDRELQAIDNKTLQELQDKCPRYFTNPDWARVAKEIKHRIRFGCWNERKTK